jgi:hypothetical protein
MIHLGDAKVRGQVVQRLALLKPNTPGQWGKMTAGQMVCHLNDSFQAVMGRKPVSSVSTPFRRTVMKWGALYLPFRWPKGVPTRPEMEQGGGGTPPGDFARDRAALVASIERFCAPNRNFEWHPHPMFGQMTDRQWLRWAYLHTDHHLRQFGL